MTGAGLARNAATLAAAVALVVVPAAAKPASSLRFGRPVLVDAARAGGEPTVIAAPNGDLVYAAHAQLPTHYFLRAGADRTAVEPFRGQAYLWRSTDRGATWTFAPLPAHAAGFGDPDFTIDAAGTIYFAAMSALQTTVARSSDGGRTWTANPAVAEVVDREWIAGGAAGEVYMSVRLGLAVIPGIFRSTDGGLTWTLQGVDDTGAYPINKLWYEAARGVLYHPYTTGEPYSDTPHEVGVSVSTDQGRTWTHRRAGTMNRWLGVAAPPATIDRAGGVYLAYGTTDARGNSHLRLVASKDQGRTWSKPIALADRGAAVFPWLVAGDAGRVAAVWFCADRGLIDTETQPAAWSVCAATVTGAGSSTPVVQTARVSPKPVHRGAICVQGLNCEPLGIDRRLGDFLSVALDRDGSLLVAYAETERVPASAVSRPVFVRQIAGPKLYVRR